MAIVPFKNSKHNIIDDNFEYFKEILKIEEDTTDFYYCIELLEKHICNNEYFKDFMVRKYADDYVIKHIKPKIEDLKKRGNMSI